MGQVGLLEGPPAGTGRPGGLVLQGAFLPREKADFWPGPPGSGFFGWPGGCQAWPTFLASACLRLCLARIPT